ncbi:MAG: DUF3467 domain-containing protein [Anaerolineales bacterium]
MTTPDPQSAKPPAILAQPAGPKLKVKDGLEPAYANLARISHSPTEFVIDFGHMIPGEPTASINARVVMTPLSAKLLLRALNENLARYESAFGEVKIPSGNSLADNLFRNLHPPEPPKE